MNVKQRLSNLVPRGNLQGALKYTDTLVLPQESPVYLSWDKLHIRIFRSSLEDSNAQTQLTITGIKNRGKTVLILQPERAGQVASFTHCQTFAHLCSYIDLT